VISFQVVQEFLNVALRRFQAPLSGADVLPDHRAQPDADRRGEYRPLPERYQLSWYDALIIAAALDAHCLVLSPSTQ